MLRWRLFLTGYVTSTNSVDLLTNLLSLRKPLRLRIKHNAKMPDNQELLIDMSKRQSLHSGEGTGCIHLAVTVSLETLLPLPCQVSIRKFTDIVTSFVDQDVYNADEWVMFHCLSPHKAFVTAALLDRKKVKDKFIVLLCCHCNDMYKRKHFSLLTWGSRIHVIDFR